MLAATAFYFLFLSIVGKQPVSGCPADSLECPAMVGKPIYTIGGKTLGKKSEKKINGLTSLKICDFEH